jgi:hypothetical protein
LSNTMKDKGGCPRAFFFCSPNIGLLDNWLPVLRELWSRSGFRITIVYPTNEILMSMYRNPILRSLSEGLFEQYIFPLDYLTWGVRDRLPEERDIGISPSYVKRIIILLVKLFNRIMEVTIPSRNSGVPFISSWKTLAGVLKRCGANSGCVLFYDIYEMKKPYNRAAISVFSGSFKFSISHALSLPSTPENNIAFHIADKLSNSDKRSSKTLAFLFSSKDIPKYHSQYGLGLNELYVSGVPRHSEYWIRTVLSEVTSPAPFNEKGYIFLISRPSNRRFYLTPEQKKDLLGEFKELIIDRRKLAIVVKQHPGEQDEDLFSEVFGADERGISWDISELHPYFLAKNSILSVVFYSGVSIDLAALRVPAIERVNLQGLNEHDNPQSLRDEQNRPVSPYAYFGLIANAQEKNEFDDLLTECLSDPSRLCDTAYENYQSLFTSDEQCIQTISDRIIAKMGHIPERSGENL